MKIFGCLGGSRDNNNNKKYTFSEEEKPQPNLFAKKEYQVELQLIDSLTRIHVIDPSIFKDCINRAKTANLHLVFPDKSEYIGDLVYGVPQGMGELIDQTTKTIYKGSFKGGLFHGQGKLTDLKGKLIYEGGFRKGKHTPST